MGSTGQLLQQRWVRQLPDAGQLLENVAAAAGSALQMYGISFDRTQVKSFCSVSECSLSASKLIWQSKHSTSSKQQPYCQDYCFHLFCGRAAANGHIRWNWCDFGIM